MPPHEATTLREIYDQGLHYARDKRLPAEAPRPLPTSYWHPDNIELLERYEHWLSSGGVSELVIRIHHIPMAGHVFGLTLKHHSQLDLDRDLDCALDYVKAKGVGASWLKNSKNSLAKFRRFLRLERGLGEESKVTPFDSARVTEGLPLWVVNELDRYQHVMQRNWRAARMEHHIRRFWSGYLRMWRFFVEQKNVQQLADLKRQHVLDYVDHRLGEGFSVSGVNVDLRYLHSFLVFLQEAGYSVPQSLVRIPGLKPPDPLPRYLTDEQVKKLRDEIERVVREAKLANHRRPALLTRAAFYLLWQGGMRLGEVEELRLEDLDLGQKRLSVRDSKDKKDRTVYLTETVIHALQEYLAVRGEGSGDHVFLFRNAPLRRDFLRDRLKSAGKQVGVKVFPHRLRHTCATQLLNAGCRVTSIQRFLGHKKLSSTMVYARAHDQTVAEDYFAAMQRVEERLDILPEPKRETEDKVVKVQEPTKIFLLIERLELPQLCYEERLGIVCQLREMLGRVHHIKSVENEDAQLDNNISLTKCDSLHAIQIIPENKNLQSGLSINQTLLSLSASMTSPISIK
jgi:integrase/recombinase XerC